MKKLLVILLAASMCVAMLAGCSTTNDSGSSTSSSSSSTATSESSKPSGDVTPQKLTCMGYDSSPYIDYVSEIEQFPAWQAFRAIMMAKGVNIDLEVIEYDQYQTTLQTRFASMSNIPMFSLMDTMEDQGVLQLADQGIIIPVNELLDAGDGTAKTFWSKDAGAMAANKTKAEDGNMYWLPSLYLTDFKGSNAHGTNVCVVIRQDWLDDCGLAMPTTLDEYTAALQAFNAKDYAGAGVAEGIGVYSYNPCDWNDAMAQWFGLVRGPIANVLDEKKQVTSPWHQSTVKDYLTFVSSLASKGLYDKEMVGSNDTLRQKAANNQIGSYSTYAMATNYEPLIETAKDALYADMMPIEAVKGVQPLLAEEDPVYIWQKFSFTNKLTDKQLGANFLDAYYSDEQIDLINNGVEGVNYTIVNGEKQWIMQTAPNGSEYAPDLLNQFLQEKADARLSIGKLLYSRTLTMDMTYYNLGQVVDNCYTNMAWASQKADFQKKTITWEHWTAIDFDGRRATATKAEEEKLNAVFTDVQTASREAISSFVLGQKSIDQLDDTVAQLDKYGLNDIITVYQAQYDRYLGK